MTEEVHTDIDEPDTDDEMACTEYVNDVYEYLREKEVAEAIDPDYMTRQKDINGGMRAILIDWLIDVSANFHLLNDTYHLTVSLIDR